MEKIREKVSSVLEKHWDNDLRNAHTRELIADEITSAIDDTYEAPAQQHEREIERRRKGIFEQYLQDPDSVEHMNSGADVDVQEEIQKAVAKQPVNEEPVTPKKRKPTKPAVKKQKKPEMSDFFDNKSVKKSNKKVVDKKYNKKRGFKNLRK